MKIEIMGRNFYILNLNKNGISKQWYWYGSDDQGRMIKSGKRIDLLAQKMGIPIIRPGKNECIHILEAAVNQGFIKDGREIKTSARQGVPMAEYFNRMLQPGSKMIKVINDRRDSDLSIEYIKTLSSAFSRYAVPRLGQISLGSFTSVDAFNLTQRLSKEKVSKEIINSVIKALRMVYGYASMCGDVPGNPVGNLKQYNVRYKERDILTPEEVRMILRWFKDKDAVAWNFMEFAVRTGARCSEILALDPEKFSRLRSTDGDLLPYLVVSIDGSWDRRLKKVGPTKGRYARKTVIPLDLGERLLAMRPDGLLFCTGRKKTPLSRFHFERLFNNACNAIGIDEDTRKARGITLHSLRHFAVTMQHAAEDEVSDMAEIIRQSSGHRSVSMDRRYTHAAVRKLLAMGILSEKVLEDAP